MCTLPRPASAVARWRGCHARAATEVAPSDIAYQPFWMVPIPARPSAAAMRIIEAADRRDGLTFVTGGRQEAVTTESNYAVGIRVTAATKLAPAAASSGMSPSATWSSSG